jgi:hypothetical protein
MKRTVAILCLLSPLLSHVYAQHQRWTFTATAGPAVPVGKFGSKNPYDSLAAFAKTGPVVELTASYRIKRHWGVSVLMGGEAHGVATKTIVSKMEAAYPGYRFGYASDPWILARLMAGVFGEWPLGGGHWVLTANLYVGGVQTKLPKTTITGSTGNIDSLTGGYSSYSYYKNIGTIRVGFAFQGGAGLRYMLDKHWFLETRVAYGSAWYRADGTASSFLHDGSSGVPPAGSSFYGGGTGYIGTSTPMHYTQPLSTISAVVGAGIRI